MTLPHGEGGERKGTSSLAFEEKEGSSGDDQGADDDDEVSFHKQRMASSEDQYDQCIS